MATFTNFSRLSCLFAVMAIAVPSGALAKKPAPKENKITCYESQPEGDDSNVGGKYVVTLDAKGKAIKVDIERKASHGLAVLNASVDLDGGRIKHGVESTGEPGRGAYESVLATSANGDSIEVRINDHSYSGWKGSSFLLKVGGKTVDTLDIGHHGSCDGPIMFPDQKKLEMDRLMAAERAKELKKKKKSDKR